MRKIKTIEIDSKTITISELKVKDIRGIFEESSEFVELNDILNLLPKVVNLTQEELDEYAPSELVLIYDVFKEVNDVFFSLLKASGLGKLLKNSISENLTNAFSDSFKAGTELET